MMAKERLVDWLARQVPQPALYQEIDRLRAENERLREALQWYADASCYPELPSDGGERARRALGEDA